METPLVSVAEYLSTSYHPDREYIDGRVIKRNLGERTHSAAQGEILTNPPHLCIEILSKDDTMQYMQQKIDDYLAFGVPYVWIINPRNRKGYVVTSEGMVEAKSGVLETKDPLIRVPLAVLFE